MKSILCLVLLIFFTAVTRSGSIDDQWKNFKEKYNKKYKTPDEELKKFEIFKENLEFTINHNKNESIKFKVGLNRDGDVTEEEIVRELEQETPNWWRSFKDFFMWTEIFGQSATFNESFEIPDSIDWRELGAVTEVKDQNKDKNCGSCYAFAAIAVLESHYFIKTGKLLKLSEQEIVDCSTGNAGCFGGSESLVYNYIIKNGISLDKDYPYTSEEGPCRRNEVPRSEVQVYGYDDRINQEDLKQAIAAFGPVTVDVKLTPKTFRFYKEGIFEDPEVTEVDTDHAVAIVGYGTDEKTNQDYWIIRNSFSKDWGETGYMRLAMKNVTFHEPFFAYFPLLDESVAEHNYIEYLPNITIYFIEAVVLLLIIVCTCCCCVWCMKRKCFY